MSRQFKYSAVSYGPLGQNAKHQFAQRHALNVFNAQAIYSFIPKNACSTLRLSLALANGCIKDTTDFNWIHQNNGTFRATLSELVRARYSFVILRDPFSRLASAYLDKIVDRTVEAWQYVDLHDRRISIEDITFEFFVRSLAKPKVRNGNIHWRPQVDFLVYDQYDDYFALENFEAARTVLREKIGLDVVDARSLTNHQTSGLAALQEDTPYKISPVKLLEYKQAGLIPPPESLFNEELIDLVSDAYGADVDLYKHNITSAGATATS